MLLLTRLERLFIAAAAVATILTVGFGFGLYHALTASPSAPTSQLVYGAQGPAGAAPTSAATQGTVIGGTQGKQGTAARVVTSGGSAGHGGTTPVPPGVCPFSSGHMAVGSVASLSTSGFFRFPEAINAAKAYFIDRNHHGGVHGCQVDYIALDDSTNSTQGLGDAKTLVADDHVFGIVSMIAPFSQSGNSEGNGVDAYFASGQDNGGQPVPVVGLDPYEREAFDRANEFAVDTDIYDAGCLMAREADRRYHGKFHHPGIFGYNVSQLAEASSGADDCYKQLGYTNVDQQRVSPGQGDYQSIASTMVQNGDDMLMWFCDIQCGNQFVQAAQGAGYKGLWINYEIGYDPTYAPNFGQSGGPQDGMAVISPFLPYESGSPATNAIKQTVGRYFPDTPFDSVTEQGWLGAQVFANEVERLALTADQQHDQALLIQTLGAETALDDGGLTPRPLDFAMGTDSRFSARVAHRCVYFVTIRNGTFTWTGDDQTPRCA